LRADSDENRGPAPVCFYKIVDAQVTFVKDAGGQVTGLVLHQGGRDLPGKKVK